MSMGDVDGAPVNSRALPSPLPSCGAAEAVSATAPPPPGAAGPCAGSAPTASRCSLRQCPRLCTQQDRMLGNHSCVVLVPWQGAVGRTLPYKPNPESQRLRRPGAPFASAPRLCVTSAAGAHGHAFVVGVAKQHGVVLQRGSSALPQLSQFPDNLHHSFGQHSSKHHADHQIAMTEVCPADVAGRWRLLSPHLLHDEDHQARDQRSSC